jgi:hypothetical protein
MMATAHNTTIKTEARNGFSGSYRLQFILFFLSIIIYYHKLGRLRRQTLERYSYVYQSFSSIETIKDDGYQVTYFQMRNSFWRGSITAIWISLDFLFPWFIKAATIDCPVASMGSTKVSIYRLKSAIYLIFNAIIFQSNLFIIGILSIVKIKPFSAWSK